MIPPELLAQHLPAGLRLREQVVSVPISVSRERAPESLPSTRVSRRPGHRADAPASPRASTCAALRTCHEGLRSLCYSPAPEKGLVLTPPGDRSVTHAKGSLLTSQGQGPPNMENVGTSHRQEAVLNNSVSLEGSLNLGEDLVACCVLRPHRTRSGET